MVLVAGKEEVNIFGRVVKVFKALRGSCCSFYSK